MPRWIGAIDGKQTVVECPANSGSLYYNCTWCFFHSQNCPNKRRNVSPTCLFCFHYFFRICATPYWVFSGLLSSHILCSMTGESFFCSFTCFKTKILSYRFPSIFFSFLLWNAEIALSNKYEYFCTAITSPVCNFQSMKRPVELNSLQ